MCVEPNDDAVLAWSPARTELLRVHYALGLSAALSAQLIGGVSRNAVISKRRRLGLMGANPLRSVMRAIRGAGGMFGPINRSSRHFPVHPADAAPARRCKDLPFMDHPAPLGAEPKTLANRSFGECAWPLGPAEAAGDYKTLFCCARVKAGRTYCPVHQARTLSDEGPLPLGPQSVQRFR